MALPSYHFKALLKRNYEKIQQQEGKKRGISIARLWEEMEKERVSRIQFEDDLLDLERKQIIILQGTRNLGTKSRKDKAIIHPTRGVLGEITWNHY